jgi:hypothetical protein
MGSKRPARREFLKSGAALAGGFTVGAATPAIGQSPASPPVIKGDNVKMPSVMITLACRSGSPGRRG